MDRTLNVKILHHLCHIKYYLGDIRGGIIFPCPIIIIIIIIFIYWSHHIYIYMHWILIPYIILNLNFNIWSRKINLEIFLYKFGTYWATISTTIVYKYEENIIKNIIAKVHMCCKQKTPNMWPCIIKAWHHKFTMYIFLSNLKPIYEGTTQVSWWFTKNGHQVHGSNSSGLYSHIARLWCLLLNQTSIARGMNI